jgi:hypothetical protein
MTKRLLNTQRIVNLSADPATGSAGEVYFNTTLNVLKYHNGTSWSNVSDIDGITLDELTDVVITSPLNGQVLTYSSVTQTWKNINPPSGGGGSSSNMAYTFWFGV